MIGCCSSASVASAHRPDAAGCARAAGRARGVRPVCRLPAEKVACQMRSRGQVAAALRRRVQRVAAADLATGERVEQHGELLVVDDRLGGDILPERHERRRRPAAAEPEVDAPARQQVGDDGVLGDPHRVFEGQRDDAGAEADLARRCGHMREEDERRRQPALGRPEVVLRDPRAPDAEPLGVADLVGREAVPLGGALVDQPGAAASSSRVKKARDGTLMRRPPIVRARLPSSSRV